MTRIETEKRISPNSREKMFAFLSDMNNFEELMPKTKIEKWDSSKERCEFTIKGMARIGLEQVELNAPGLIKIKSFGKVPFTFELDIHLNEQSAEETEAFIVFEGNINPFMKMMVEKPLKNFFSMLVDKAAELKL